MLIAIYEGAGCGPFTQHWKDYARENHLDAFTFSDIDSAQLDRLLSCDVVMWHWSHLNEGDQQRALALLSVLEARGVTTFPGWRSRFQFDDKIAQSLNFVSLGLPTPRTWMSITRDGAERIVDQVSFPVVAKLRKGASATNVRLLKDRTEALSYIGRAFGRGFPVVNYWAIAARRWNLFAKQRSPRSAAYVAVGLVRWLWAALHGGARERGYVYLQEFIPDLDSDYRVVIVGGKAFCIKRFTEPGDFRASGSKVKSFGSLEIPVKVVKAAFEFAARLGEPAIALDIVVDSEGVPMLIEASYGFATAAYPGYWDRSGAYQHVSTNAPVEIMKLMIAARTSLRRC